MVYTCTLAQMNIHVHVHVYVRTSVYHQSLWHRPAGQQWPPLLAWILHHSPPATGPEHATVLETHYDQF